MSLNNLFGPHKGRPDHPDMTTLVDIILQLDGHTEDPDFDMEVMLATIVDPASVSYLSLQRALRMTGTLDDPILIARLATMWIDGFLVGVELGRRSTRPA